MNLRALSPIHVLLAAGLVGALGAGCGDGTDATLEITGAWARTSPMNVDNGAAYLRLTSPVDDTLLDVAVDAEVAMAAELHETVMSDAGMSDDTATTETTMGGMTMQEIDSIALPAGQTVALEPGGYHVMLLGLSAPLETGATIELTLTLDKAGTVVVEVPVLDEAP